MLRLLQSQWPEGMLQFLAWVMKQSKHVRKTTPRHFCDIQCGILLKDGRFAFLMMREHEDLRSIIDRNMLESSPDCGPFPKEVAEEIMSYVALGMDSLHTHNIVHRDLKSSNVLIGFNTLIEEKAFYVADFECSIGIIGTGFFRAPEILQACKDGNVRRRPMLFTKKVDVYSYGMTCYEILTGKLPFEGHSQRDYDLVLEGQRPEVPEYVDDWARELQRRCWHSNPKTRPTFGEILDFLEANSAHLEPIRRRFLDKIAAEDRLQETD